MCRQLYEAKKGVVIEKVSMLIKPTNMPSLNEETVTATGITQQELNEKGVPLAEAMIKVSCRYPQ